MEVTVEKDRGEEVVNNEPGVNVPFYSGVILGALGLTTFELEPASGEHLVDLDEMHGEGVEEGSYSIEFVPTVEPDTEQMTFAKTVIDSYCELVEASVKDGRCRFVIRERE